MSVEQSNLNSYFLLPLFCCHYPIIKDILNVDCLYYWLEPLFVYVKNKLFQAFFFFLNVAWFFFSSIRSQYRRWNIIAKSRYKFHFVERHLSLCWR